jgi:hypothetical protein
MLARQQPGANCVGQRCVAGSDSQMFMAAHAKSGKISDAENQSEHCWQPDRGQFEGPAPNLLNIFPSGN